jgi:hypothetical protein
MIQLKRTVQCNRLHYLALKIPGLNRNDHRWKFNGGTRFWFTTVTT